MIFGFIYASACVEMNINNVDMMNVSPIGANICCNGSKTATTINPANNISFGSKREMRTFLRWMSKNFSSPQQRAVLGVTALCFQPFIDLHNKYIKNEDKPIVVSKTIAKIVTGTTVGVFMRHYAIKAVKNFTQESNVGKYSQCLLPKNIIENLKLNPNSVSKDYLANYRNGLGTLIGLSICLFTNFLIDAPLTKILTNVLHDKVFKRSNTDGK